MIILILSSMDSIFIFKFICNYMKQLIHLLRIHTVWLVILLNFNLHLALSHTYQGEFD